MLNCNSPRWRGRRRRRWDDVGQTSELPLPLLITPPFPLAWSAKPGLLVTDCRGSDPVHPPAMRPYHRERSVVGGGFSLAGSQQLGCSAVSLFCDYRHRQSNIRQGSTSSGPPLTEISRSVVSFSQPHRPQLIHAEQAIAHHPFRMDAAIQSGPASSSDIFRHIGPRSRPIDGF